MVQPTTERGNCSDLVGWPWTQAETSQENVFYLYSSADTGLSGSRTELAKRTFEMLFSDLDEQHLVTLWGLWSSGLNGKV